MDDRRRLSIEIKLQKVMEELAATNAQLAQAQAPFDDLHQRIHDAAHAPAVQAELYKELYSEELSADYSSLSRLTRQQYDLRERELALRKERAQIREAEDSQGPILLGHIGSALSYLMSWFQAPAASQTKSG